MRPVEPLKDWARRFWKLGFPRVALALGAVLVFLSLFSPLWSYSISRPAGIREVYVFNWATFTFEFYLDGAWQETSTRSYSHPTFTAPFVASTLGGSYLVSTVFLLILVGIFFVLTFLDLDRFGPFGYLILALLVVISGLLALFYPVVALPGGLAADLAPLPIGGSYWGSATTGSDAYAWGAGLGWWLLAFGVLLAGIGASLPYLKSVREMRRVKPWDRPRAA
ncbi:MAG: hypothetical protein A3K68_03365 [Euryarchaeota archaeon RBG_16_68_13]|nr:MAG: hypothetical protein A3K68_03365 [Euryarchaeota archaeon RBG_16_68_13]